MMMARGIAPRMDDRKLSSPCHKLVDILSLRLHTPQDDGKASGKNVNRISAFYRKLHHSERLRASMVDSSISSSRTCKASPARKDI